MKILALIHGYPPLLNAGGEWYMKNWLTWLVNQGHFVTVRIADNTFKPYEIDGVKVDVDAFPVTRKDLATADIVISHLNRQGYAVNLCEEQKKPLVIVQHNYNVYHAFFAKAKPNVRERFLYCIYNSQHVKDKCGYHVAGKGYIPTPSMIMRPPVFADRVKVPRKGTKISLVNLWDQKGGDTFLAIASRLKDKQFLGVEGGYAKTKQIRGMYPNLEYVDNTPDIKSIYAQSRIMLMPSLNESWGMVAIEAAASGIPTIAAPTPGLKESLGNAGIFVEKNDVDGWIDAIQMLDDPAVYKEYSAKAKARFKELESIRDAEMAESEQFLKDIIDRKI